MYSVWFCDCTKAIEAMREKVPNMVTFCSIHGNVNGDFVIKDNTNIYIVKHKDFSVWRLEGSWRTGNWIEIK